MKGEYNKEIKHSFFERSLEFLFGMAFSFLGLSCIIAQIITHSVCGALVGFAFFWIGIALVFWSMKRGNK